MTTSNTGHGDVLTEDQWIDLAERHANRDWNCRKPGGYLNTIKALCRDYAALSSASSGAVLTDAEIERLWNKWVCAGRPNYSFARAILAATQRAEPVVHSGVPFTRSAFHENRRSKWVTFNVRAEHADAAEAALNAAPPAAVQDAKSLTHHYLLRALADEVRASGRTMIADELEALAATQAHPAPAADAEPVAWGGIDATGRMRQCYMTREQNEFAGLQPIPLYTSPAAPLSEVKS